MYFGENKLSAIAIVIITYWYTEAASTHSTEY